MAHGIGVSALTMGRCPVPPRTPNAASIRLPNPGAPVSLTQRVARAMAAVEEYLVRRNDGLVLLLFTPPFDSAPPTLAILKGTCPVSGKNGGQYTHAAIWSVLCSPPSATAIRPANPFALLNPINHASTRVGVHRYKVEPYVVAADILRESPHIGRGSRTWYTGSAGWMYRAGLEWILGFVYGDDVSRPLYPARVAELWRSRSAITPRATTSSSRIPTVWRGGVCCARWRTARGRHAYPAHR